jgi:hypothetical protein
LQNHKIISLLASSDNHVMMQDYTKKPTMTADCKLYSAADMNLKNTSKNKNSKQRISRSCLFADSIKHCFRYYRFLHLRQAVR